MGLVDSVIGGIGGAASSVGSTISKNITSLVNASENRLSRAEILPAGLKRAPGINTIWNSADGQTQSAGPNGNDWRIRISVAPGSPLLYNIHTNKFLQPLLNTGGVIFPITPNLQVTHNAKYSPTSLTHSNYGMHFYEGSEVAPIVINGEFPIQNIEEGQYLLAAIYFFRAATKMFWGGASPDNPRTGAKGEADIFAGAPPPMVFLNGYGAHYFPNVSCVVTSFMHSMPETVDYIDIPPMESNGETTRLPTLSTLTVTLQPILSRTKARNFNLESFAHGEMIKGGYI